jgi:aspartate-semialdehyde dehydrogenase
MSGARGLRVGILGATGLVGRAMVDSLAASALPLEEVRLWATAQGAGTALRFGEREIVVRAWPGAEAAEGLDAVLLATSAEVSRREAPGIRDRGALVVDNSRAFRMEPDVPLVVPEVNAGDLARHRGIVANPNCSTIQLVVVLAVLRRLAPLRRVQVATYQAASGVGREGLEALAAPEVPGPFPHPLAGNVIPQCDTFVADGWTREEWKMKVETRKILHAPGLRVEATCVRVPVAVGHAEAVAVDLGRVVSPEEVRRALAAAAGVVVEDEPERGLYPLPRKAAGRREVFVGRIRRDPEFPETLHLWIVADNVLKGAAWNAVQILQEVHRRGWWRGESEGGRGGD